MAAKYKSPKHKLVKFFEGSRDTWKTRANKYHGELNNANNKLRYHKNKSKELRSENKQLLGQIAELEKALAEAKKNQTSNYFSESIYGHTYSVGHVSSILNSILSSIGLRASAKSMTNYSEALNIIDIVPCWQTGRDWLLKLGLYKLNEPKEYSDDWVWITDHSIQLGAEKVLLVLGIREKHIPAGRALTFDDLTTLGLYISRNTNSEVVKAQLSEVADKYGSPMHIVSDGGPDLKRGIDDFIKSSSHTSFIYDIKHKIAIYLKKLLGKNDSFLSFCELAAKSQGYMRQTDVAALAPPNQRSKSRFMNLDGLINWANKIIALEPDKIKHLLDEQRFQRCLGWLSMYVSDIDCWTRLIDIAEFSIKHIAENGIYRGLSEKLMFKFDGIACCPLSQQLAGLLVQDAAENEYKVKPGHKTVGSSDIIESVFGCFKNLEKQQSASGFTSLVLAIPAMVGGVGNEILKLAMENTKVKQVRNWITENLGLSVQAKRKLCYAK
jgi:hypothetical protein